MSRKIKALISILAGIVVIVAAVFIVIAISGSSGDVTIFDFRVLNKNGDAVSYELNKKTVYLTNPNQNYFEFAIYLEASDPNVAVIFESSDESVAKASIENGKYICRYYKAGEVTITAYAGEKGAIKDKFDVVVKENIVKGIVFAGSEFVDQSGDEVNINIFSDSKEYVFPFEAVGFNSGLVNYDSIKLINNPDTLTTKIELDTICCVYKKSR